ncbi:MAG: dehydratase [Dehalococcoidia bacterium]|nr:dehydratase [Dehalococcoidia bacterium]
MSVNTGTLEPDMEIPSLVRHPDTRQLAMWAEASGDNNPIHLDGEAARAHGLPRIVMHGQLGTAFLCRMLSDWYGREGRLRKIAVAYKGFNYPDDTLTCRGRVKAIDGNFITLEIWIENQQGAKTTEGTAVVEI